MIAYECEGNQKTVCAKYQVMTLRSQMITVLPHVYLQHNVLFLKSLRFFARYVKQALSK